MLVKGGLHLVHAVGWDGSVSRDRDARVRGSAILTGLLACIRAGGVGVNRFELRILYLVIIHGARRVATVASIRAIELAIGGLYQSLFAID